MIFSRNILAIIACIFTIKGRYWPGMAGSAPLKLSSDVPCTACYANFGGFDWEKNKIYASFRLLEF